MDTTLKKSHHVRQLASLFSFTPQYIRLVLRGKRHNRAVTDAYNTLVDAESKTIERARKKIAKAQKAA